VHSSRATSRQRDGSQTETRPLPADLFLDLDHPHRPGLDLAGLLTRAQASAQAHSEEVDLDLDNYYAFHAT
jgi:hypothetical protein